MDNFGILLEDYKLDGYAGYAPDVLHQAVLGEPLSPIETLPADNAPVAQEITQPTLSSKFDNANYDYNGALTSGNDPVVDFHTEIQDAINNFVFNGTGEL